MIQKISVLFISNIVFYANKRLENYKNKDLNSLY
ncbi:MAG: hypothetical protein RIR48_2642, partial [Bacteroidota bacterium]